MMLHMTLMFLILSSPLESRDEDVPFSEIEERLYWNGRIAPGQRPLEVVALSDGVVVRSRDETIVLESLLEPSRFGSVAHFSPDRRGWLAIPGEAITGKSAVWMLGAEEDETRARLELSAPPVSAPVAVPGVNTDRLALLLATGDLVLLSLDTGRVESLLNVGAPVVDRTELFSGLFLTESTGSLIFGAQRELEPRIEAYRYDDGSFESYRVDGRPLPSGVVSVDDEGSVWFLTSTGSLYSYRPFRGAPQQVFEGSTSVRTGLTPWGGREQRGLAWGDEGGRIWLYDGVEVHLLFRAEAPIRWPLLSADFRDDGDLQLLAIPDNATALLIGEDSGRTDVEFFELGYRTAGPFGVVQADPDQRPILTLPTGVSHSVSFLFRDVPTRDIFVEESVIWPGQQVHDGVAASQLTSIVAPLTAYELEDTIHEAPTPAVGSIVDLGQTSSSGETQPIEPSIGCSASPSPQLVPATALMLFCLAGLATIRRLR